MIPTLPPRVRAAFFLLAPLILGACGGGGGGDSEPQDVIYSQGAAIYRQGEPISANVPALLPGAPLITSWTITPALPPGLVFDPATGVISGTPVAPGPLTVYTVSAHASTTVLAGILTIEIRRPEVLSIAPKESLSDDDRRHLLSRTAFGFVPAHYNALLSDGIDEYLDNITRLQVQPGLESAAASHLQSSSDPQGLFPSERALARWWTQLIQANGNPFQEVLALHWHDHFAASSDVLSSTSRWWFVNHVNLWRHGGAGNLRQLLIAMARDWSMLEWLDGIRNNGAQGQQPNENFAREFFELFCLGVDNGYTQQDIVEAARAFTGYRKTFNGERDEVVFSPNRHDSGSKTILGQTIPGQNNGDDYQAVVDITLALRVPGSDVGRCAQWIVRSLLRHFGYEQPPAEVTDDLARLLESGGWELRPVLITFFRSETFYSTAAKQGLVKSPIEFAAGFIRATGLAGDPIQLETRWESTGNRPTQPPTVNGWPEGIQWFSAQAMVDRANMLRYVVTARSYQSGQGANVASLLPSPTASAGDVVDALALRLRVTLSAPERLECVTYLDTQRDASGAVFPSPFDALSQTHLDERVRGLLYILGQHPTHFLR